MMGARDTLCKNLIKCREERKWTQKMLAEKLDVVPVTVSGWENGRKEPAFEILDKIAALFNTTVAALFTDETDSNSAPPVLAQGQADFLRSLCTVASSPYLASVEMSDRVGERYVDDNFIGMSTYTDIALKSNRADKQFRDRCKGSLALCESYRSGALPEAVFEAAVQGLVSNVARQEKEADDFSSLLEELEAEEE